MINTFLLKKLKFTIPLALNFRIKRSTHADYQRYNIYYVNMNRLPLYPFGIILALSIQSLSMEAMALEQQCISTKSIESDELSCLLSDRIINDTQLTSMTGLGPLRDDIVTASLTHSLMNKSNSEPAPVNTLSMNVMPLALGINAFPASGDVGIGTDTPQKTIHLVNNNTPTIRFEQLSGTFIPYTWDLGANETNLFFRDQSGSDQLPFRIARGNATNTLTLKNNSVGIGTWNPAQALHVIGNIQVSNLAGCSDGLVSDTNGVFACGTSEIIPKIDALNTRISANNADIVNLQQVHDTLNQLAVQYDSASQDVVTLKGMNGTKLTNLQAGDISTVNSKDAVTGGQLFTTNQNVTNLDNRLTNEVGNLDSKIQNNSTAITGLDVRVSTNETDIANLQQGQGTLNQLAVQYDSASQDVVTLKGMNGTKLTNLQAGDISTVNSKDAVTGGQLFTTNQNVAMLSTQATTVTQQLTSILGGGANYSNGVFNLPTFSIQGKNYSNIGDTFSAVNNEISFLKTSVSDLKTYVDQQNNGNTSNIKSYIDQQDSKKLKEAKNYIDQKASNTLNSAHLYTDQQAATALKNANAYTDSKITGLNTSIGGINGKGLNSTAIGPNTVVTGDNSTAVGVDNNVSGNNSGAFGDPNIVTANGSYIIGNDNTINGDNTFVLGNNVKTEAKDSVVLGNNSAATRDNTVSVGASGNERQITYVADATESTDAVNLRQLQATNTETLKSSKDYTNTRVNNLESRFSDFSYQTDRRFQEVDKRFDRQGAMSAAMMNMATSTAGLKGLNRVGLAAGFQGDEKAVAIGYQRIISENASLSLGGAFTDEYGSGGAGIGFSW